MMWLIKGRMLYKAEFTDGYLAYELYEDHTNKTRLQNMIHHRKANSLSFKGA